MRFEPRRDVKIKHPKQIQNKTNKQTKMEEEHTQNQELSKTRKDKVEKNIVETKKRRAKQTSNHHFYTF